LFNNTCVFTEPERDKSESTDDVRHFFVTEEPFPANRRSVAVVRTIERKQTPLLREVSLLSSRLNDMELRLIAFKRVGKQTDESMTEFSVWASQTFDELIQHLNSTTIPQFVRQEFTGDEAKLQERVSVLLTRICSVIRGLIVVHSNEALNPARVAVHARLCDQATEILRIINTPPSSTTTTTTTPAAAASASSSSS